ncbi:MAG: glycosyltransferase family 39 protein [Deltaproteobacteria bacterium]|nr:glycosyltransferase family 39 protein [Deltaproteobacteria bacterium]
MEALARPSARRAALLVAGVAVLYGAALNPWYLPEQYDDFVYHQGAREILSNGCFCVDGMVVGDWGPALPLVLAGPASLGLDSVIAAKAVVLLFVCAALALWLRLARREGRPLPLATAALFALAPTPFLLGTRIMSEWPFAALAFLFLLMLRDLREKTRGAAWAVATGAVLAAAMLTRFAGVTLLAAVAAQAIGAWRRERRLLAPWPEAVAGSIGAVALAGYKAYVAVRSSEGAAVVDYQKGVGFLMHFEVGSLVRTIGDAPTHIARIAAAANLPDAPVLLACSAIAAVMLVGLARRVRSGTASPPDAFVAATLVLFAFVEWKFTRYLLPVTPFLLSWLFDGVAAIAGAVARLAPRFRLAPAAGIALVGLWAAGLLAVDATLLFSGNGRSHGGLSMIASPTAEDFYKGYWRDLWAASQAVRAAPGSADADPRPVALLGKYGNERCVFAFSGRRCVPWVPGPETPQVSHVIAVEPAVPAPSDVAALGLVELSRHGSVTVWRAEAR